MGKISNDKYRIDVICARDNGLALASFCRKNSISINSLINHLIVSFLLNKHKYAFNFVDDNDEDKQQGNSQQVKNDIHAEDNDDNFPDIIKSLLDGENEGVDYSF